MSKRVLIAGFKHETNTFSIMPTDLAAYRARGLQRGTEIAETFTGTNTELAAFMDAGKEHGWEVIPVISADATPSGKLTRECYEAITGEILDGIAKAGRLDAILLNLHGAMVAEHTFDGEGTLLERIREKVGRDVVIGVSLDLHANVTELMGRNADVMVAYRTYPHIDLYDTGKEVAALVARTLAGKVKPRTIVARGRQMWGVDEGRTTAPGPMREALEIARGIETKPGVLSCTINAGFPWADIPEVGPTAMIVVDQGKAGLDASHAADAKRLVDHIWETRHRQTIKHMTIAEGIAVARAKGKPGAPVVLADFADNPGGGGYCDTPGLIARLIEAGIEGAAMSLLYDPETTAQAVKAGVGARIDVKLGGKVDPAFGRPIEAKAEVRHVSDGRFKITGPMMTGMSYDIGPVATIRIRGVDIVVGSKRMQNYDLGFFRIGGIEPKDRPVLAVKSMQHFRAAYAPIASEIVIVDEGGGITSNDLKKLPFKNVRRPIYPLDLD
ncbi:MAG TPA: M81 family metallopeptidase [Hyphomicrobiaceae bacterium]|nr:M81 family metallopeptidase [Hyphomicrobiaceae bacterium]